MVRIKKGRHPGFESWLASRARRHLRALATCRVPGAAVLTRADLSLWLTGDREIRRLNKEWRGKDKSTDVLSFPLFDVAGLRAIARERGRAGAGLKARLVAPELGDVVISFDTASRQAKEHGVTLRQELDLLLVHGLLHLLGFDHEISLVEERRMRRWEKKLLGRGGLIG